MVEIEDSDATTSQGSLPTLSNHPDIEMQEPSKLLQESTLSFVGQVAQNQNYVGKIHLAREEAVEKDLEESTLGAVVESETKCDECGVLHLTGILKSFCETCSCKLRQVPRSTTPNNCEAHQDNEQNNLPLQSAIAEIRLLEEQLSKVKDDLAIEKQTLKTKELEISVLVTAASQRDSYLPWPRERILANHAEEINRLNLDLQRRDHWSTFINTSSLSRQRACRKGIIERFQECYVHARDIPFRPDNDSLSITPSLERDTALNSLAWHGMGRYDKDLNETRSRFVKLSHFSSKVVLQTLANSAMQKWIFETEFPHFEDSESEILANYRKALIEQGKSVFWREYYSMTNF